MTHLDDGPPVRLVLDLSALRAYTAGSIHVGETLLEVADDGVRVGVPLLVAVEALATATGKDLQLLHRLFALDVCVLLPHLPEDLLDLTYWRRMTRVDMAAAAVAALAHDASLLTREGRGYGDAVPVIHLPN